MACASAPSVKILCWNVKWGHLSEKVEEIGSQPKTKDFDIICLLEAYKAKNRKDRDYDVENFKMVYLGGKRGSRIGGMALYVKKDFCGTVQIVEGVSKFTREGLLNWFKVDGKGHFRFYLCVVYIPGPGSSYWAAGGQKQPRKEQEFFNMIRDVVKEYNKRKYMVIVAGDFNCRIGDNVEGIRSPDDGLLRHVAFNELVQESNLYILNGRCSNITDEELKDLATYYGSSRNPTVVDYALVNEDYQDSVRCTVGAYGKKFELVGSGGISDHRALSITVEINADSPMVASPGVSVSSPGFENLVSSRKCEFCGKRVYDINLKELELDLLRGLDKEERYCRLYCKFCQKVLREFYNLKPRSQSRTD